MNVANMSAATRLAAMQDVLMTLTQSCDTLDWLQELVSDSHVLLTSIKDDMEPATAEQYALWTKLLRDFANAVGVAADTICVLEQDNITLR